MVGEREVGLALFDDLGLALLAGAVDDGLRSMSVGVCERLAGGKLTCFADASESAGTLPPWAADACDSGFLTSSLVMW